MFNFVLSCIALLVISATMLARANDLRWQKGLAWNARLVGFILAGFAPFGMMGIEFRSQAWPNFFEVLFRWGLMLVFVTTPYLPPWWKWISGKFTSIDPWWHHTDRRVRDLPFDGPERREGA